MQLSTLEASLRGCIFRTNIPQAIDKDKGKKSKKGGGKKKGKKGGKGKKGKKMKDITPDRLFIHLALPLLSFSSDRDFINRVHLLCGQTTYHHISYTIGTRSYFLCNYFQLVIGCS